ncbi:hypothetical protein RchiOBHm_Chr1g0371141 [Rosa chinensis]|uniref:Uncharacterized protein n=1 Tax=Rosa chinensis TaxID=74649 RepID=A0A2P6SLI0_ROSCH|nr:hypothetical protein RchiOBHm_Chr1g0371141 [Rosa chinensis]
MIFVTLFSSFLLSSSSSSPLLISSPILCSYLLFLLLAMIFVTLSSPISISPHLKFRFTS